MSDHWISPFLHALRRLGIVTRACAAAGVSTATIYARKAKDADFAAAFDEALEEAVDGLEAEAWRRALHGVEEPVIYQGQLTYLFERNDDGTIKTDEDGKPIMLRNPDGTPQVLTIRKPSDRLLEFVLKGRRKKVFGDETKLSGGESPVRFMDETTRAARTAQLLAQAAARKKAAEGDDPPVEELA